MSSIHGQFAELALVQEPSMEKQEQSLPCMYYLAVNHYLRGQFTEAILHLERAVDNYGKVYILNLIQVYPFRRIKSIFNFPELRTLGFNWPLLLQTSTVR